MSVKNRARLLAWSASAFLSILTALSLVISSTSALTAESLSVTRGPVSGGQHVTINGTDMKVGRLAMSQITAGAAHTCGIYNGAAYCWGNGTGGQLGNGVAANSSVPVAVDTSGVLSGKTIIAISAGSGFTIALADDGKVYAWGANNDYQLGDNGASTTRSLVPVAVVANGVLAGKRVVAISAGNAYSLVLADDGKIYSWGFNSSGQLGDNSVTTRRVPVAVATDGVLLGKKVAAISAGTIHSLAVTTEGRVYSWGANSSGQLGDGTTTQRLTPTAVNVSSGLSNKVVTSISAGISHSAVLTSDGVVYSWGPAARIGDGLNTISYVPALTDVTNAFAGKVVKSVKAGGSQTAVVTTDGQVFVWGDNSNGQLGDGTTLTRNTPVPIATNGALSGKSIEAINVNNSHMVALGNDGQIYAWGYNNYGQLGDGTLVAKSAAVAINRTGVIQNKSVFTDNELPQVTIDGVTVPVTSVAPDGTMVSIRTAPHAAGSTDLVVKSYDGTTTGTLPDSYTFMTAPVPTAISPASGSITGGDTVTITGQNFANGAKVKIGKSYATNVSVLNSTTIIASVAPTFLAGAVDVVVEDGYGQASTLPRSFTYEAVQPTVTSISPAKGPAVGNQQVTVDGADMYPGVTAKTQISAGIYHSCGVYQEAAYCWGYGTANGSSGNHKLAPTQVSTQRTQVSPDGVLKDKTVTAISSGHSHTLALTDDGKVYSWGINGTGQLGDGTTTSRVAPVAVDMTGVLAGKVVTSIATGGDSSFAVTDDGKLYAWGVNSSGQLGINSTANKNAPVAVDIPGEKVIEIGASSVHTVALTASGKLYAWGNNQNGQFGNGGTTNSLTPIYIELTGALTNKKITAISAGKYSYTVALADDGKVYTWGNNQFGQLGNGTTTNSLLPVEVDASGVLAGKTITAIKAGQYHTLALADDSSIYAWGSNNEGQLGNSSTASSSKPVAVHTSGALAGKTITAIAAGAYHSLALSSDGYLYAWGDNQYGAIGDTTNTDRTAPVAVNTAGEVLNKRINGINDYPVVSLGGAQVKIITGMQDGSRLIGRTSGHGAGVVDVMATAYDNRTAPSVAPNAYEYMAAPTISSASPNNGSVAGGDTVTILGSNFTDSTRVIIGTIYAESITLHDATSLSIIVPPGIIAGPIDIAVEDEYGQRDLLTNGFTYIEQPVAVTTLSETSGPSRGMQRVTIIGQNFAPGIAAMEQIAVGDNHACGIYSGAVYCWGANNYGQLGDGSTINKSIPVAVDKGGVLKGKVIVAISVGVDYTLALSSDGNVYAWGSNSSGQLGDNSTATRMSPVAVDTQGVLAGKAIVSISAGSSHSLAAASDGSVYAWGSNSSGQLGDGSSTMRQTPVAVYMAGDLANKKVIKVSAGVSHSLAITDEGRVYSWGSNSWGQLGSSASSTSNVYRPTSILYTGGSDGKFFTSISAGWLHSLAVTSDGSVYAWGSNGGKLGDGTSLTRYTPVPIDTTGVLSGKNIKHVAAGNAHSLAVDSDGKAYAWGSNSFGESGDGTTTPHTSPVEVNASGVLNGRSVVAVDANTSNGGVSIALTADGQIVTWGRNHASQLGNNSTVNSSIPVSIDTSNIPTGRSVNATSGPPAVTFGGATATTVSTARDGSSMVVITPARAEGLVNVRVTNYDGQYDELASAYTYIGDPKITAVSPNSGSVSGGDTVTITGSSFTKDTLVSFGGVDATATFVNNTTMSVTVPAGVSPGIVDVAVRDPLGQQSILPQAYTYRFTDPAVIQSTTPSQGLMAGGDTVTITGSGFMPKAGGGTWYKVWFGATEATNVTYVNSTTLTARAPTGLPGKVDVTVGGEYVEAGSLQNGYQYLAQYYVFSGAAPNIETNIAGKMTITAQNASRSPVASTHDTVITLSSSSTTGKFAVDLNESESTRWGHTQVILPAGQSSVDIWYKDSVTVNATVKGDVYGKVSFTQIARVGTPYRLQVTGLTNPIKAGVPSSITVRVVDTAGKSRPDYTGTLKFSSPDSAAKVPGAYVMQASDYGIKTFTNGVTFGTQGAQCVKVADLLDPVINGMACSTVQAPSSGSITKLVVATPEQRIAAGKKSAAITIQAQDTLNEAIPVSQDTPVYLYSNSTTGEFSLDGETWQGLNAMPVEATMSVGTSSINVWYRDSTAATFTISARDLTTDTSNSGAGDQGWKNAAQQITTGVSPPTRLVMVGPDTLVSNTQGTYRIELQDDVGNVVTADTGVAVRTDSSTTTGRFYTSDAPTTALAGPIEFMIPEGETGVEFGVSDTTLSVGTTYTNITATDARPETEVVRLNDALFGIQVVASLASRVTVQSDETEVAAGVITPITVDVQNEAGDSVYVSKDMSITLKANPIGEFSLTADPFVPVSTVRFARGEPGKKTMYFRSSLAGTMTLSAAAPGFTGSSDQLEVVSDTLARYDVTPSGLTVPRGAASSPLTVTGYDIYGNIVTRKSDHTVYLYSSSTTTEFSNSPSETWGVSSIVVPLGESTAQFVMRDTHFSDAPIRITVSDASALDDPDTGVMNDTTEITIVSEAVSRLEVKTTPRSIKAGGVSDAITVQLQKEDGSPAYQDGSTFVEGAVDQGYVSATADAKGETARLAVPKGQAEVTFYYTGTVAGVHEAEFSVGQVKTRQNITVEASQAASAKFTTPPQIIQSGQSSESLVVGFYDAYNNPTKLDSDTDVSLSSSCVTGTFSESATDWQMVGAVTVPKGSSDVTFYYKDTQAGDCTITVTVAELQAIAQIVTVENSNQPVSIAIESSASQPQIKGAKSTIAVSLRSVDGTIVSATSPVTIYLATTSTKGVFTPATLVFEPGESTLTTSYYQSDAGKVTLTARDQISETDGPSSMTDATLGVEYSEGVVTGVALATAVIANVGQQYPVTVSLVNENNIATNAIGTSRVVAVSSSQVGGVFSLTPGGATSGSVDVTIPAGQSTTTVYYKQAKTGQVILRGTSNAITPGEVQMTVLAGEVATIGFTNIPYTDAHTLDINEAGSYSVSLYDEFGNVAIATQSITLYVSSTQPGNLSANEIVIESGQSSGSFTYKQQTAGAYKIMVATAPSGQPSDIVAITQDGSVAAVKPQSFRFVPDTISLERGAVSQQVSVQLLDANGQVVAAKGISQTIRLSMQSGTGQFAKTVNDTYASSIFLTIPVGSTSASFYYRNNTGSTDTSHVIVGSSTFASQEVKDTLPVSLSYGESTSLQFMTPERTQQATHPSQIMTVEQRNRYGQPVPATQDTVLHLRSSADATGSFGKSKVEWGIDRVVLPAGEASVSFYYKDSATGTPTISVAESLPLLPDTGILNAKQRVTIAEQVVPRTVDNFLVTNISDPQHAGTLSSVVVVARDAEGYVVEDYRGSIRFSSSSPDAKVPSAEYAMYPWLHRGVLTVPNAVSFSTPGEKMVSVTDVATGITGSQNDITVISANTKPVASVAFADSQPIRLSPNEASPYIAVQLLDEEGRPTSAPLEGLAVRLTSNSTGGLFASAANGSWQNELEVTIPAGAGYAYVYYKDSQMGSPVLSVSDWDNGSDSAAIANDSLRIDIQTIYVEGSRTVKSRNALGVYEESKYLYAHNSIGEITGRVQADFTTYSTTNSETTSALWRTQWRQGVTLLESKLVDGSKQSHSFTMNDITARAGDNDFYAIAEATKTSFNDLFSIASNQQTVQVSPWKTELTVDTQMVGNGEVTANTRFYDNGMISQPKRAFVYLLPSEAVSISTALQVLDVDGTRSITTFNTDTLNLNNTYKVLAVTYDDEGEVTSQAVSDSFSLVRNTEEIPPITGVGKEDAPRAPSRENNATAPSNRADVDNKNEETANQPGVGSQPEVNLIGNEASEPDELVAHVSGYVAASTLATSVIVIALLREAYKEVSRVVRLRSLLRRENQLVEDKQTFLSLGAHYLRTPIAILDAAASMVSADVAARLTPIIQSLKQKSEQLLTNQSEGVVNEKDASEIKHASRNALLSIFFWIPIILSIALTIATNWLLSAAQVGATGSPMVIYAVIIGIAVALAAFFVARTIAINHERERLTRALEQRRALLFNAKSQFIQDVKNELSGNVRQLTELKQALTINQNQALVGPINESIEKLNLLTGKLALASHINGVPLNMTEISAETLIAGAVNARLDQISQKQLKVHRKIFGFGAIKQDARLLNYVVASLVDNAVKFAPQKTELEVTARTFGGHMKVNIENSASGVVDESVIERMFEPFNHASTPNDLTVDGMGMSLYLNKLIMGHLGGSIEARRNVFRNTIEFVVRVNKPATV